MNARIPNALLALLLPATLASAQILVGNLVDHSGAPLVGARVTLSNGGAQAFTNSVGAFVVLGLRARTYDVLIDPLRRDLVARELTVEVPAFGVASVGTVTLEAGVDVRATVLDPTGAPVNGGAVIAYTPAGERIPTPGSAVVAGVGAAVVPSGAPVVVRVVPPPGRQLVPAEFDLQLTAATNLGVSLQQGFDVRAVVVDAAAPTPIVGCTVIATDVQSGARVPLLDPLSGVVGFRGLLPTGLFDLDFLPPPAGTWTARRLRSVPVIGGNVDLGLVALQRGVVVRGHLAGPTGPVQGALVEAHTADGRAFHLPACPSAADGGFAVRLPTASYTLSFVPPAGLGLVGHRTPLLSIQGETDLGATFLTAGVPVALDIASATGQPVDGARLEVIDPTTGATAVVPGAVADATGRITAVAPPGEFDARITTPQGSHSAATATVRIRFETPVQAAIRLPQKRLVTDLVVVARGSAASIPNGGALPFDWSIANLDAAAHPVLIDAIVPQPNGAAIVVVPALPFVLPAGAAAAMPLSLPMPTLPNDALGQEQQLMVRLRDPATLAVLDAASVTFVPN